MISSDQTGVPAETRPARRLSPNIAALGCVSMLTAISSAMIYGLLPVFLVRVLEASVASVGLIEGMAESTNSFIKIVSGMASDWIGRRKPIVLLGYTLSAAIKTLFPVAETASMVLAARMIDRAGKGIRDAPRDAFVADVTAPERRGSGFGLRLSLGFAGFVIGPLIAVVLMRLSGDDFRLVFWIALIPACLSILVLLAAVTELPCVGVEGSRPPMRWDDLAGLPAVFWWSIGIAGLLSLARFSQAFLVLKAHDVGVDAAFVPLMLVVMHLFYSTAAYPFGVLSDTVDRRVQLGIGAFILIGANLILASADTVWWTAAGAALWGLQLAVTQGLLGAMIADTAPGHLRGTAFGIYDVAVGFATLAASAGAGALWTAAGPAAAFGASAAIAIAVAFMLLLRPLPKRRQASP